MYANIRTFISLLPSFFYYRYKKREKPHQPLPFLRRSNDTQTLSSQNLCYPICIATAFTRQHLRLWPHLPGYLSTHVAYIFSVRIQTFMLSNIQCQVHHFMLYAVGILIRASCQSYNTQRTTFVHIGKPLIHVSAFQVLSRLDQFPSTDAHIFQFRKYLIHEVTMHRVIDCHFPIPPAQPKCLPNHRYRP